MSQNTVYYSNKCMHSRELIKYLSNNGFRNSYKYICIDNGSQIPPFIKNVPSLLVIENNNNKLLVGDEIMNYINSNTNSNNNSNNPTPQGLEQPEAWHNNEMGASFSDMYSFLEDNSASISHSFSFLNGSNTIPNSSNTNINMTGTMTSNNEHKDKLSKDMDSLMQQRDRDMPNIIQRI